MEELNSIRQNLRKVEIKESPNIIKSDLTQKQIDDIRTQFFDSGVQNWFHIIEKITFPSFLIDLKKETASVILSEYLFYKKNNIFSDTLWEDSNIVQLAKDIKEMLEKESLDKFFIKLSTRSPKDSPLIKQRAVKDFKQLYDPDKYTNFEEKIILFTECIQNNFYVDNEKDAIELLISSERVYEDLLYAYETTNYEIFNIKVVIREWKEPVPIQNEFRGFVWNGNLNAIGQYYHLFYFKNLQKNYLEIVEYLKNFYDERLKPYLPNTLTNCIVDFAFYDRDNISIIEINPFDAFALGSFSGSTGLFNLENKKDLETIQNGPFEIRVKTTPSEDKVLKGSVAKTWIEAMENSIK